MYKAVQVPSDVWEKQVLVGENESGKIYDIIRGNSKEEVEAKARQIARKRKLAQQNEWQKENMERVSVVLGKGTKERIKALGVTFNGFVREAVEQELARREANVANTDMT